MQEELFNFYNVQDQDIEKEMRSSYIDYAMSVIVGRALPDVRDGLKPVHRRILYAMYEQGMVHNKPYKKCARVVGEVLGKYHPHGDTAVYDSLVRMAQEFSLRYPLVDGQGNFGSIDGDNAAAMRYTEARMSKLASELLADIEKETVEFTPNFDESLTEPTVLPTKVPNLLINGSSGIAVGMATNIPPHNLEEVCQAVKALLDDPSLTVDQLMEYIKGPDFPTAGTICGRKGIIDAYHTGKGIIKIEGRYFVEEVKSKKRKAIIITELPYAVNKAQLIIKIADLVKDKTITGIADLRDESDRKGMRIYVELKRDANEQIVTNQLLKHTQLRVSYGINSIALVNGQPKLLSLKEFLANFITHRFNMIKRRVQYDLKKAEARAHILEGLRIALDNLDEVISLIKESKDAGMARTALMNTYSLSEIQAQAILDMKLQKLTGLEREKIEIEHKELLLKIEDMKDILANKERVKIIIKEESDYIIEKYGNPRRTEIAGVIEDINIEDLIKEETVVVFFTKFGFVKRVSVDTFRMQLRGGRGIGGMNTRDGDFIEKLFVTSTHSNLVCLTSKGKCFQTKVYNIPEESRYSKGTSINNIIHLGEEEKVTTAVVVDNFKEEGKYLFMTTRKGIVKKVEVSKFQNIRANGIIAITLDDDDELSWVNMTDGSLDILLVSNEGMVIRFAEDQIRATGRSARGVIGMRLKGDDYLIDSSALNTDESKQFLLVLSKNGRGKLARLTDFRIQKRSGLGLRAIKLAKIDSLASGRIVNKEDEVIIVTEKGTVSRQSIKRISVQGRAARGVMVQKLDKGDKVVAFKPLAEQQYEQQEEE